MSGGLAAAAGQLVGQVAQRSDVIKAWTFEARDEGEIKIKIENNTPDNLKLWIGDKRANKNTTLDKNSVFYWNFCAINRNTLGVITCRTHHWGALYNPKMATYLKFSVYDEGAPRGNNLFVITNNELQMNKESYKHFRALDNVGRQMLKEYKWT